MPKVAQERRRFVPAWKREYPWVYLNDSGTAMLCQYCLDAGKSNAFTAGCDKFKKDALRKHAVTTDHRSAVLAKSGRRDMQRAITTAYRSQEQAVVAALRTVYFMAKKNLANDIFSDMKHFLVLQVSIYA